MFAHMHIRNKTLIILLPANAHLPRLIFSLELRQVSAFLQSLTNDLSFLISDFQPIEVKSTSIVMN